MVRPALFVALLVFVTSPSRARPVVVLDMPTLMKASKLVFVGQVKSIKPSGITTALSYPAWDGVVFEWLRVEVEVVEPVKGTKKGEIVSTLMLSAKGDHFMFNAPGMVEPEVGQFHLLFLLPAAGTQDFAAITAPFDDDRAIFLLDRERWASFRYQKEGKETKFHEQGDMNRALWNLINDKREISPEGAAFLREKYAAEIATVPPKEAVIHLKWKKQTSAAGWDTNVPDRDTESDKRDAPTTGPTTKP